MKFINSTFLLTYQSSNINYTKIHSKLSNYTKYLHKVNESQKYNQLTLIMFGNDLSHLSFSSGSFGK